MNEATIRIGPLIPAFAPGWADVFGEDEHGIFAELELCEVTFVWRWIPPGRFLMGSPEGENGRDDDEGPQHEVTLTQGFWLGETPVTQKQWKAVTGDDPSEFKGEARPVEQVSWHDCQEFVQRLNQEMPELYAALPSEAQWEYACRAGSSAAFNDGSSCEQPVGKDPALLELGWFHENSESATHDVRLKRPNAWGLYDCHGNVDEWCQDGWKRDYTADPQTNPRGPEEKVADRVARGGAWGSNARDCRSAFRDYSAPGSRWRGLGLRLAAGQPPEAGSEAAEPPGAERPAG